MSMDDEQQQIPIAFSQQMICNPKVLIIQGRDYHFVRFVFDSIDSM